MPMFASIVDPLHCRSIVAVGTKTAKTPSGLKAGAVWVKTHLDLEYGSSRLALERMKENGKGKKRKVATIPDQAKAMGNGATEARGRQGGELAR